MTATKIERLTKFAVKLVPDAFNVAVTKSAGVLWVGCDDAGGKRYSRPIGTDAMPTNYLKAEIRQWAAEIE